MGVPEGALHVFELRLLFQQVCTILQRKEYGERWSGNPASRLIRLAGRTPIERDPLYRPVQRTENAFTVLA